MARHDIFWAENGVGATHKANTATTSGDVVLAAAGVAVTLTGSPTGGSFYEGQPVSIVGGGKTAICVVTKVTDATHITIKPIQSAADTAGAIGATFSSGATVAGSSTAPEKAGLLSIDLTDAPFDSADYLVLASLTATSDTASAAFGGYLAAGALSGDPLSYAAKTGAYAYTSGATPTHERAAVCHAAKLTLTAGQRYEFAPLFFASTSGASANVDECRMIGLRLSSAYVAGDGATGDDTQASTTFKDHLALPTNLPAGTYLIACTWALGIDNLTYNARARVIDTGGLGTLAFSRLTPNATTDRVSCGFVGVVTLGATNALSLAFSSSNAAGTAHIGQAILVAMPLPPGFDASYVATPADVAYTTPDTATHDLATGSVTLARAGTVVQVMQADTGCENQDFRIRSIEAGSEGDTSPLRGLRSGNASNFAVSAFSLFRGSVPAGSNGHVLRGSTFVAGGVIHANNVRVTFLSERKPIVPGPDERVAIVAEIEGGGLVYVNWLTTGVAQRFRKHTPGVDDYSQATLNGVALTRVASTAALGSGKWYYDAANMDLYVQLASGAPSDVDKTVVVVPLMRFGRSAIDLADDAGVYHHYASRIKQVPSLDEELRSEGEAKFSLSTSIGALQLAASDGLFDDMLGDRSWESWKVRVWRGFPDYTDRLADFDLVCNATLGWPSSDMETLTVKLFDQTLLLQQPIATTKISVYEGDSSSEKLRTDQQLPIPYGSLKRVTAYRITKDYSGTGAWNTYQFAPIGVSAVSAAYIDGASGVQIAAGNLDVTATYVDAGKLRVKSNAFADDPTKPADVVYVDIVGKTSNGASSGVPYLTAAAIARDILLSYGGRTEAQIDEASLRLLDRTWRKQLTADGFVPLPPRVGLLIGEEQTPADALSELLSYVWAYWRGTRQGRIRASVPDLDSGDLLAGTGGFEGDAAAPYPWKVMDGATYAASTSRRYDGLKSAQITNGGSPTTTARLSIPVVLPRGGRWYVFTLLASLSSGDANNFRLGILTPGRDLMLSDPVQLLASAWQPVTLAVRLDPGEAGLCLVSIYPSYGTTTPTSVFVDNARMFGVAFVADGALNSAANGIDFREEHYYQVGAAFDVNLQDSEHISKAWVTDSEARQLGTSLSPAQAAIPSSTRADLGMPLLLDLASASGVAAPVAVHFSRPRAALSLTLLAPEVVPQPGDYVYVRNHPRVPELPSGYPIWRVVKASYKGDNAQTVEVDVERQLDLVKDRGDISPDAVPVGLNLLTLDQGAISDYTDNADLADKFLRGNKTPDVLTARGATLHQHDATHVHAIPSHHHSEALNSIGIDSAGDPALYWLVSINAPQYPPPWGPAYSFVAARGLTAGGHDHGTGGGSKNTADASGTSTSPNSSVQLPSGGTSPPYVRCRVVQRTDAQTTTIDHRLIVGFLSTSIPSGWARVSALDGYAIRGATSNSGVSTNVATSTFSPSDSGSSLKVASSTNIKVGKRLVVKDTTKAISTRVTVTAFSTNDSGSTLNVNSATNIRVGSRLTVTNTADGNKLVRVYVSAVAGTVLTVVPLHEKGDQSNSYSFPNSANSTVTGDTSIAVMVTAQNGANDWQVTPLHEVGDAPNSTTYPTGATSPVSGMDERAGTVVDVIAHDHGGAIPSHTHGGPHAHVKDGGLPYWTLDSPTPIDKNVSVKSSVGAAHPVVVGTHDHVALPQAPVAAENSGSAGGTVLWSVPQPAQIRLVWISPTDDTQTALPTGAIGIWTLGTTPPPGYRALTEAENKFVAGALAGMGYSLLSAGHAHGFTAAAHGYSHAHGTTYLLPAEDAAGDVAEPDFYSGQTSINAAAGHPLFQSGQYGHSHLVNVTISAVDPGLSAASGATGSDSTQPPHARVMLVCKT